MGVYKLDNCEVEFLKCKIIIKQEGNNIEINEDTFDRFQKLIKLSFTRDNSKGQVYQLSKTCLCLFREKQVYFCENNFHIKIEYDRFGDFCKIIYEHSLDIAILDRFEEILLRNFLNITFCLDEEERKVIVKAFNGEHNYLIDDIVMSVLKSSKLRKSNEYFQFILRKLIKDHLKLL